MIPHQTFRVLLSQTHSFALTGVSRPSLPGPLLALTGASRPSLPVGEGDDRLPTDKLAAVRGEGRQCVSIIAISSGRHRNPANMR